MKQGWTYKKLGELGTIVTGSTPSTKIKEYYCSNDYCFIKPSDLPAEGYQIIVESENYISSKGYEVSRKLPKGSVLVSCIGIIGKTAILGMDACTNQQINAIIPNEYVNNKFLAYSILSQRYVLSSVANAPVVPLINKSDFSKVEIPLPPLSTQLSIVSELDKINELIRLKREQLKDYDNLAQSIFYEMFGDPHYNEKRWDEVIVGDVCAPKAQILRASKIFGSTDEIQYIDISSIDNLAHEMTKCTTYTMSDAPSRAQQCVKKGDIVISTVRPNIKNIAIVSKDDENLVASSGFCILRPNNIDRNFLFHYILSEYYTEYLVNLTTGANYPAVRDSDILKSKIYYPPISIQQSFAQRIELIEQQKAEIQNTIADLETLLASRMQYWFD